MELREKRTKCSRGVSRECVKNAVEVPSVDSRKPDRYYARSRKVETSISISKSVLAEVDRLAGTEKPRSAFLENVLRRYLSERMREALNVRDLAQINRAATKLHSEAEDVLEYQATSGGPGRREGRRDPQERLNKAMYIHLFAFRFKAGVTEEQKERIVTEIGKLKSEIPQVLESWVGRNESPRGRGYELGGLMKFADKAACDAYGAHPVHEKLLSWLMPLIEPIEVDFREKASK
jgi:hypothetical protein